MNEQFLNQLKQIFSRNEQYAAFRQKLASGRKELSVRHFDGFVFSYFLKDLLRDSGKTTLVITSSEQDIRKNVEELQNLGAHAVLFPTNGRTLFSYYAGTNTLSSDQIDALFTILHADQPIVFTTLRALLTPYRGLRRFLQQVITFRPGMGIDTEEIAAQLSSMGYYRVPKTTAEGEFTLRGEVFDVFPPGMENPYRMVFDWDEIAAIRTYDPVSQKTFPEEVQTAELFPYQLDSDDRFDTDSSSVNAEPAGSSGNGYIWDIIGEKIDHIVFFGDSVLDNSEKALQEETRESYREALTKKTADMPSLQGGSRQILYDYDAVKNSDSCRIYFADIPSAGAAFDLKLNMQGPRSFFGNISYFREEMENLLDAGYAVHIFAGSKQQKERLQYLLTYESITYHEDEISSGFSFPEDTFIAVSENEIFGRKKRYKTAVKHVSSKPIDTFVELQPDDYIVHIEYGIGIFRKIERIHAAGRERDYIKIEYANNEHVFIPIEQVDLLQKYIGQEGSAPRLDVLGGRTWESKKQRVRKSVEDLAEHLIELYAKRQRAQGSAFPEDTDWQLEFEAAFPYEETEDQLACIDDVKQDMEKPEPMDRLICGDVGFGKTEVAIRAAFKAVTAGKQVAFLAPTTILAEQHYENILERFSPYPIEVAMLSRLVDKQKQKKVLKSVSEGTTDVIIGTHRILQKDILFRNLGLLIIDEEQRFGVKDKERIKELKLSIDCLSLSATPIPRTLYMSLLKIRDISLLRTPPLLRRPIRTIIEEYDPNLVREAIIHETERGGQVFYLHNRVDTLQKTVIFLQKLLPELYIDSAHGKMSGTVLEKKMHDFINGKFQVLVSTTIIENGIDIPNVNTIIIDRADRYGISQLYQLRGRVGRSTREAFAFLFYPKNQALSEVAMKRLKTISEHTDLGSGFKIAMKDMEIRGTGNILGREQHGQMVIVGLDMYLRMLDKAVSRLSQQGDVDDYEVFLDLDYTGYIPNSYISDPSTKFDLYKRIASITDKQEIESLLAEIEDKYGPVPAETANLLYIAELKVICRELKISSLRERNGKVRLEFRKVADISIDNVMHLIRESGGNVTVDHAQPNILLMNTDAISLKDKSLFILEKLQRLAP